ncbi:GNAT family N-acetyltransferase [Texcoconibacillus texcoconensis]|uniref:GNAT superfamily N-acetyltransferase n=1 Tax=Texcoconibacillus texcoconensis TaxID=1095777 RepID=A0A840QRX3_9BACI|nr:GNAT family N-acetyltransferase [Texcoconibacillus texcoconensis]MBB5174037.1 GNAT superfamily N-acetyltransferase [Texcoconibacillus texcoconensis]
MNKSIRVLQSNDYAYLEAMETGIEDDYIPRIFDKLTTGNNRLYGLFLEGQLVSMGGCSIYAGSYAMLGRLRSDRRFRGNHFGFELMSHVMNEVIKLDGIKWIGANTQEENIPARRVVDKLGLVPYAKLHGAVTKDTSLLESGAKRWTPIESNERKKAWLQEVYVKPTTIFPYECYYPFPASEDLFQGVDLEKWCFFENEEKSRVLITKYDQKKNHYLHTVYPWDDMISQEGLWETIANEYHKLLEQCEGDTYIWMDLTKEEANKLPDGHSFELSSPWILYGKEIENS